MAITHKRVLLFDKAEKNFKGQGLGIINSIIDATTTSQEDGFPELDMVISEQCMLFDKIEKMNIILINGQLFRIWDTEYNSQDKQKEVFGRHILYDMNSAVVYNKKYNTTLQNIVDDIIKSIDLPYKYSFVFNMGNYANTRIEYEIEAEYAVDAILKAIEIFEEENIGTKIEFKTDNFDFGIFLFEEEEIVADTKSAEQIATVVNCYSLNVRSGAGTKYKVIGWLQKGDNVVVLSTSNKSWYKIKTPKGIVGYSARRYLGNLRTGSSTDIVDTPLIKVYGLGRDTGIRFDPSKVANLLIEDNMEEFCTRVLAIGKENLYKYYTSPQGTMGYPFHITKIANFSEADTTAKLKVEAEKYLKANSVDIKNISIELNQIFGTDLYKDLILYKDLKLYDWVWVKHPSLNNYYQRFKICKIVKDAEGKVLSVELGKLLPGFAKRLKEIIKKS